MPSFLGPGAIGCSKMLALEGKRVGPLVFLNGLLMREGNDNDYVWFVTANGPIPKFNRKIITRGDNPDLVTIIDPSRQTRVDLKVVMKPVLVDENGEGTWYPREV